MEVSVVANDDQVRIGIVGNIDERGAEEVKRRFLIWT